MAEQEKTTGFSKVRFHERSSSNDPKDVEFAVNGDVLQMQRNKELIIPNAYREVADHAVRDKYEQVDGQVKAVGKIRAYTYDFLGTATEKEYLEQRKKDK